MVRRFFLLGLWLFPQLALGGEQVLPSSLNPAGSSVSVGVDGGSQAYRAFDASGKIAIGPVLRFDFDVSQSTVNPSGSTKSLTLGGDARVSPAILLRAALLLSREPNEISSAGVKVGGDYTVSELWHGERETLLSLDFTASTYRQGLSPADATKKLVSRFRQREWTLGLSQELSERWTADFSASRFSYPSAPANLNAAVNNRRQRTARFSGPVDGFPESSVTVGTSYKVGDWKPGLSYSHARVVLTGARADTFGASLGYELSAAWILGAHASRTRQEYEAASSLGGLTADYSF